MKPPGQSAFTLVELLIVIVLVGILAALSLPAITTSGPHGGVMTHTLSNQRQLHLATQQMALDGLTTGDTNLGWPGDIGGTFTNWAHQLVADNYLSPADLTKLLSAPGKVMPGGEPPIMANSAILVYATSTNSAGSTVFLTSANFTNTPTGGVAPIASIKPYGAKGFVVFRQAGDGAILQSRQAGQTNLVGTFAPLCR